MDNALPAENKEEKKVPGKSGLKLVIMWFLAGLIIGIIIGAIIF